MDSTKSSLVAIILLNWNGYAYTRQCLLSLQKVYDQGFQVIIVDNASTDGSLEKLKSEFKSPIFLSNSENFGFTGGNNIGIRYALEEEYEYIMLLNNDTEVEPDFLQPLLSSLKSDESIGAVQPLMYFLHDKTKVWNAGGKILKWTGSSLSLKEKKSDNKAYVTEWITGCCILLKSKVIQQVGVLNDEYFAYFEDVDWSLRIRRSGYNLVVVPSSIIYHEAGASSKSKKKGKEGRISPKVHYLATRNQLFQLRNHVGMPYAIIAWPYQIGKFVLFALYFALRNRKGKLLAIYHGLVDGILNKKIVK